MISKEAIELFEELGYTEYSDSEHYDFYTNPHKNLTIEIRKYINEYVKHDTNDRTKRRGIDSEEHQAITQALKELNYINQPQHTKQSITHNTTSKEVEEAIDKLLGYGDIVDNGEYLEIEHGCYIPMKYFSLIKQTLQTPSKEQLQLKKIEDLLGRSELESYEILCLINKTYERESE